ncbi:aspartic peptidase domain-containing protein, partial [Phialemonium atrogriseum]
PSLATGLKSVQFGVATSTVDEFSGILGIGYGQGQTTRYKNFIDELSAQNATKVKAFTVALGSKHIQEGVIVFGGVDASKFSGTLARLPIIPAADSPDQVPRYWIQMQSLQLTPPSGKSYLYPNSSFPVFLDSGATMTLLPASLAAAIASDFGSTSPKTGDFYEVSCDLTTVNGTLDFAFDGTTVKVPYDELIRVVPGTPPACFLGISPSDDFTLLGDSFMRSAYTTFDLENNVVWMTQAANCGSTPAALGNMNVMSTLQGLCGTNKAVATDNTNSGFPSDSAATVPGTSN